MSRPDLSSCLHREDAPAAPPSLPDLDSMPLEALPVFELPEDLPDDDPWRP